MTHLDAADYDRDATHSTDRSRLLVMSTSPTIRDGVRDFPPIRAAALVLCNSVPVAQAVISTLHLEHADVAPLAAPLSSRGLTNPPRLTLIIESDVELVARSICLDRRWLRRHCGVPRGRP